MTTASVYDVGMLQMGKVPYPASENTVQSNSNKKKVELRIYTDSKPAR